MSDKKNKATVNEAPVKDETLARAPKEKPVKRKPGLYVKPGRAITSRKGVLGSGIRLEPKFFAEGVFNIIKENVNSSKSVVEEVKQ